MKSYPSTTIRFRIAVAVVSLAIAAGLLEVVAGGLLYPDAQTVAARRDSITAQADQAARARALAEGQVKSASSALVPGI